jgi:hypothetical protein
MYHGKISRGRETHSSHEDLYELQCQKLTSSDEMSKVRLPRPETKGKREQRSIVFDFLLMGKCGNRNTNFETNPKFQIPNSKECKFVILIP